MSLRPRAIVCRKNRVTPPALAVASASTEFLTQKQFFNAYKLDNHNESTSHRAGESLANLVQSVEINERYTEALVRLSDGSLLGFVHRVGERRVKSFEPDGGDLPGRADQFLDKISMFPLTSKHYRFFSTTIAAGSGDLRPHLDFLDSRLHSREREFSSSNRVHDGLSTQSD